MESIRNLQKENTTKIKEKSNRNRNSNHNHNKAKETAKTLLIFKQIRNTKISDHNPLGGELVSAVCFPSPKYLCVPRKKQTKKKFRGMLNYNIKANTKFDLRKTFNEMSIVAVVDYK